MGHLKEPPPPLEQGSVGETGPFLAACPKGPCQKGGGGWKGDPNIYFGDQDQGGGAGGGGGGGTNNP